MKTIKLLSIILLISLFAKGEGRKDESFLSVSCDKDGECNMYEKVILGGDSAFIAEYLLTPREDLKIAMVKLTFTTPISDDVSNISLYVGDVRIGSNPIWDKSQSVATFSSLDWIIAVRFITKLTVNVCTKQTFRTLDAKIASVEFNVIQSAYGGYSLPAVLVSTPSNLFNIVPILLVPTLQGVSRDQFALVSLPSCNGVPSGILLKSLIFTTNDGAVDGLCIKDRNHLYESGPFLPSGDIVVPINSIILDYQTYSLESFSSGKRGSLDRIHLKGFEYQILSDRSVVTAKISPFDIFQQ